jgi:hypothetical protein
MGGRIGRESAFNVPPQSAETRLGSARQALNLVRAQEWHPLEFALVSGANDAFCIGRVLQPVKQPALVLPLAIPI